MPQLLYEAPKWLGMRRQYRAAQEEHDDAERKRKRQRNGCEQEAHDGDNPPPRQNQKLLHRDPSHSFGKLGADVLNCNDNLTLWCAVSNIPEQFWPGFES